MKPKEIAWELLGRTKSPALLEARLQLHHAAQIPASIGYTFADEEPDWGHTSLRWNDDLRALVGARASTPQPFAAGLDIEKMSVILTQDGHSVSDRFDLPGRTIEMAYKWLSTAAAERLGNRKKLTRPEHELPPHGVAKGHQFGKPTQAHAELFRWYRNAAEILEVVKSDFQNASPVRCWPHHFDIATLISLDPDVETEKGRSIGVGMAPGDMFYSVPYWYVTPWPYPQETNLPTLGHRGRWHITGWTGAVLPAESLDAHDELSQAEQVESFIRDAIQLCRDLLS